MLDKNKEIMVRNYNAFAVSVSTKMQNFVFPAAERGSYSSLPLTWDEIIQINNSSKVFKNGFLMFPEEDSDEIYSALRILDYKDILTNEQIENIVLHPTRDGVEKLIAIDDDAYFDRARGIYTYLRNNGYDISNRIDTIMELRYTELKNNKKTSSIVVSDKLASNNDEKIKELENRLSEMEALKKELESLRSLVSSAGSSANDEPKKEVSEEKPVEDKPKPAPKKKSSSTGSKKAK